MIILFVLRERERERASIERKIQVQNKEKKIIIIIFPVKKTEWFTRKVLNTLDEC